MTGLKYHFRNLFHYRHKNDGSLPVSSETYATEIGSDKGADLRYVPRRPVGKFRRKGQTVKRNVLTTLHLVDPENRKPGLNEPDRSELSRSLLSELQNEIEIDVRYRPIQHIAEGGNGIVNLCQDTVSGTLVAVKTIEKEDEGIPLEAQILTSLGANKNIVSYLDCRDDPTNPRCQQIIFEYYPMGDLADFSQRFEDGLPEVFLWSVFRQMSSALSLLHRNGITHGDFKLSNILVAANPDHDPNQDPNQNSFDPGPILKLADFGAAQINAPRHIPRAQMGTWGCAGPESGRIFGFEMDIWGLGTVIHMLALGVEPCKKMEFEYGDIDTWFDKQNFHIVPGTPCPVDYKWYCLWMAQHPCAPKRIDKLNKHAVLGSTAKYSKLLNHFMMRCLDLEYTTRINAFELEYFMPTLERFVSQVLRVGYHELLDQFQDVVYRWHLLCKNSSAGVSDSRIILQVYLAVFRRACASKVPPTMRFGKELLDIMDTEDRTEAYRIAGGAFA